MPIKIQSDLPACSILENENIFVMTEQRAATQDIRPLKIAIVNLMPAKEATETQLLRLLGNTPLQIDISLIRMESHITTHTGEEHLEKFYVPSGDVFNRRFDGMIITGAPVEQLPYEAVDYWNDLCGIMDYARQHVFSTLYICWGSQAGLYYRYGIEKQHLDKKMFGIYPNTRTTKDDRLLRGFDDIFPVPMSRHTTISAAAVRAVPDLTILAETESGDATLIKSNDNREIYMSGHLEYDTDTLAHEYWRDKEKGLPIDVPVHYFPHDDPAETPLNSWRSTAHLFYSNWLNYCVYQETPFSFA
jgi:homoserine O-succinyltransferase/O-acetyltransferase